jgi:hypothetical protein
MDPKPTPNALSSLSGAIQFLWDIVLFRIGRVAIVLGTFYRNPADRAMQGDRNRTSWIGLVLLVIVGLFLAIRRFYQPQ